MKSIQLLAPLVGMFAAAQAWDEYTVWTTVVTTDYTTYCPSPTTFAWHNVTYTATSETTVTITNCPCTVTYSKPPPVTTTSYATYPTYPTVVPPPGTGSSTSYLSQSTYYNVSSTVIISTPPVSTIISGTVPITTPAGSTGATTVPTRTPVGPTTTSPVVIPTAAADKVGPVGALLAAGLFALAL
ncbi:hypothetical protein F4810DRAFT_715369 [Camillea tinctor]|nr:hypothetical protein F4810DRAFT_715369 [Camillea tinctor]